MIARVVSRLGLWLAAFALLAQTFAATAPPLQPRDARTAAAELTALFGQGVFLCVQADDPAAPAPPLDCRDHCPLCQLAADAAALNLPAPPPWTTPPRLVLTRLVPLPPPVPEGRPAQRFALARGPPSQT